MAKPEASKGKTALRRYAEVLSLALSWFAIVVLFRFLIGEGFWTQGTFETIARQTTIVALAALGMTFVVISGGIDLSVGSLVAFVTVVIGYMLHPAYRAFHGVPGDAGPIDIAHLQPAFAPALAILAGIVAAVACGLLNGLLITKLKMGAFIVTLGTMGVIRGLATGFAAEQKIDAPSSWISTLLAKLPPDRQWMRFPPGVWLMLAMAGVAGLVLRQSRFGRQVVALGGNEQAAHYSGIQVDRTRIWVFALMGLFAGLAGVMQFSRLTVGDPTVAVGLELDVIAAVVIGGASLSGGHGSIPGTLLGALIMGTIGVGCDRYGLPNWVQGIVTGAIIVIAVGLDRLRKK